MDYPKVKPCLDTSEDDLIVFTVLKMGRKI